MTTDKKIGKMIKDLRIARRIYQSEIADYLGVSLSTYQNYEKGLYMIDNKHKKSKFDIDKISEFFNVDSSYFYEHQNIIDNEHDCFIEMQEKLAELLLCDISQIITNIVSNKYTKKRGIKKDAIIYIKKYSNKLNEITLEKINNFINEE